MVQPKVARRGEAAAKQWNEILALPESAAVVEEMRSLTTDHPEHLTPEREKAFRDIAAGHDRHEERLRELSQGRGRSL